MHKAYLATGALMGALAIALGAFGAHGLKKIVTEDAVQVFQTGVQYQVYHSLALLVTGILFEKFPNRFIQWAGTCFITGIILFSGSLYLLTMFKALETGDLKIYGMITPFGGLFFISGWLLLFIGITKKNKS